uniref:Major facilitator superfamily (MFS) profile domain-containing protein n=1 Tax=Chelonoidis abingdonii TaxID=106734 RepID=A0A8C0G867_CHEAB
LKLREQLSWWLNSPHLTFPLLAATLLASFGSSLLYGYNLAVVNSPAVHIKAFYNATWSQHYGQSPSQALLTIMYSLTVSVFALGGLVGSFPVGMLVTRYGSTLLVFLAGILMGFSRYLTSPEMVILGRFITGLHSGICLSVVPMYLGEIAPKNLRGFLGLVPSIFICLGVFSAQVLGLPELLGEIWFYTNTIFQHAGIPGPEIPYSTVGTGAIEVLAGLLGCFTIEKLGRRPLLIIGFSFMGFCCAGITLALVLQATVPWMRYLSVACVVGIIAGFCMGPAGVPFLMTAELFKQSHRPAAYIVGGSLNWLSNFTVGFVFPFLQMSAGAFCYLVFCGVCVLVALYVYLIIPETKNKTFVEISQIFATRRPFLTAPASAVKMVPLGGYGALENSSLELSESSRAHTLDHHIQNIRTFPMISHMSHLA